MSLLLALCGLLLAPPAGAGQALADAPAPERAALDALFDKAGSRPESPAVSAGPQAASAGPVLRAEDDPLPKAPRFALNLGAIPAQYRHTVPGFETLFHRNQEETEAWVRHMNALIRAANARPGASQVPEWTYDPRPNEPAFTCLSFAAGAVSDWWSLQLGKPLGAYVNPNNGAAEPGLDPELLELEYFKRAERLDPHYVLTPRLIQDDPVRHYSAPVQPLGYAELLIENAPFESTDPVTGAVRRYDPASGAMEGQYLQLFENRLFRSHTPDRYAKVLAEGIDKWGIAYVQLEHVDRPRLIGAHTVAAVGYFCLETDGRLIQCSSNRSDEDWGRTAYFIIHDSFGDFPAAKTRDAAGGSAYRAVRVGSVDQAIVFPHGLALSARPLAGSPGTWELAVANKGGNPVSVLAVNVVQGGSVRAQGDQWLLTARPGAEVRLTVEARHYYEADGGGREFVLRLDSGGVAYGEEKARSAPSRTYHERRGD